VQDTLFKIIELEKDFPQPNKISIHTPIGSIETGDESPVLDVLIVGLVFVAFCIWIYARFFVILKK
jgi:hypothetical protein|tara:strand:- start:133 stop:330 length:198 start_codon:yes stop_codon:yes gene_type:complete